VNSKQFEVGDLVKIVEKNSLCISCEYRFCEKIGEGKIIRIEDDEQGLKYCVEFEEGSECYFSKNEIEKVKKWMDVLKVENYETGNADLKGIIFREFNVKGNDFDKFKGELEEVFEKYEQK